MTANHVQLDATVAQKRWLLQKQVLLVLPAITVSPMQASDGPMTIQVGMQGSALLVTTVHKVPRTNMSVLMAFTTTAMAKRTAQMNVSRVTFVRQNQAVVVNNVVRTDMNVEWVQRHVALTHAKPVTMTEQMKRI